MKEMYADLQMEIIAFGINDVITASDGPTSYDGAGSD